MLSSGPSIRYTVSFFVSSESKTRDLPLKIFPGFQKFNLTLTRGGTLARQMMFEPTIQEDSSQWKKRPTAS